MVRIICGSKDIIHSSKPVMEFYATQVKNRAANLASIEKDDSNSCPGIYALGSVMLL